MERLRLVASAWSGSGPNGARVGALHDAPGRYGVRVELQLLSVRRQREEVPACQSPTCAPSAATFTSAAAGGSRQGGRARPAGENATPHGRGSYAGRRDAAPAAGGRHGRDTPPAAPAASLPRHAIDCAEKGPGVDPRPDLHRPRYTSAPCARNTRAKSGGVQSAPFSTLPSARFCPTAFSIFERWISAITGARSMP